MATVFLDRPHADPLERLCDDLGQYVPPEWAQPQAAPDTSPDRLTQLADGLGQYVPKGWR